MPHGAATAARESWKTDKRDEDRPVRVETDRKVKHVLWVKVS